MLLRHPDRVILSYKQSLPDKTFCKAEYLILCKTSNMFNERLFVGRLVLNRSLGMLLVFNHNYIPSGERWGISHYSVSKFKKYCTGYKARFWTRVVHLQFYFSIHFPSYLCSLFVMDVQRLLEITHKQRFRTEILVGGWHSNFRSFLEFSLSFSANQCKPDLFPLSIAPECALTFPFGLDERASCHSLFVSYR